jgi:RNA polymerase sigma factor (sigma-70 family)
MYPRCAELNSQPDPFEMYCIAPNYMADAAPVVVSSPLRARELAALSARELVVLVREAACMRELDAAANAVVRHFYARYKHSVSRAAQAVLRQKSEVGDVVQEVFVSFWKGAAKFDPEQVKNGEAGDAMIAAYLGRRAGWFARNRLRPEDAVDPREFDFRTAASKSEEEKPASRYAALRPRICDWLDTLTVQQRAVADAYILNNEGRNTARVPRKVIRELCVEFDVTPSALRHMKRNLTIRLTDYLNAYASEKFPS